MDKFLSICTHMEDKSDREAHEELLEVEAAGLEHIGLLEDLARLLLGEGDA